MALTKLSVSNLRNIRGAEMHPCQAVNLICGPNASGKTSLLEAIHILGRGRSFRTNKHSNLIRKGSSEVTLYGEVEPIVGSAARSSIGVTKSLEGKQRIRIDRENERSTARLLKLLPLQLIVPETFQLLSSGPKARREFVDWGVFHVEHNFMDVWQRANRAIKQRNALLRDARASHQDARVWERELVESGENLARYRDSYLTALLPVFETMLASLLDIESLSIKFYTGWDNKRGLQEVLEQSWAQDVQKGYTHAGPHRADLRIRVIGQKASDILSRGQQKLVVAALKLAQGALFTQSTGRKSIYLIDDLAAELDEERRVRLCELLAGMGSQLFVTGVDSRVFKNCWIGQELKMFHVKHGTITAID